MTGPKARFDPDAEADSIIGALESRCNALGVHPGLFPKVARMMGMLFTCAAADRRQAGRLDDARRIAAVLTAFARKLGRRDPAEAEFHLIMSHAFAQESKNAWKVEDFPAIEMALRKSLDEARTAIRLDPRNVNARIQVAGIQDKLVGLVSGRLLSR